MDEKSILFSFLVVLFLQNNVLAETEIKDSDGDTKVQVEES